jgi:hypothetical protein
MLPDRASIGAGAVRSRRDLAPLPAWRGLVSRLLVPRPMTNAAIAETISVDDYWGDLNREILGCLAAGPVSPGEIGRRLGISEGAAASCLSLLAAEGRVRICLVEKGSSAA